MCISKTCYFLFLTVSKSKFVTWRNGRWYERTYIRIRDIHQSGKIVNELKQVLLVYFILVTARSFLQKKWKTASVFFLWMFGVKAIRNPIRKIVHFISFLNFYDIALGLLRALFWNMISVYSYENMNFSSAKPAHF